MSSQSRAVAPNLIRSAFAEAMSRMYQAEVPQYGALLHLVAQVNDEVLGTQPDLRRRLHEAGELGRIGGERHGAIRLGRPDELAAMRRLFAVMGMRSVGYYDLSVAGIPIHSTCFRPVGSDELRLNPFRVFTSLLRLDLIDDAAVREEASEFLARRTIFTPDCLRLIDRAEAEGGLCEDDASRFIQEALLTFRWRGETHVPASAYQRLRNAHPLVADIACFEGPHINHLTPRTLDIDAAQLRMRELGLPAKSVIEGPPRRRAPILLRQTAFQALQESITFVDENGQSVRGAHTARFGEIEQRGAALTPKGRALYDRLLGTHLEFMREAGEAQDYARVLADAFSELPDDETVLRREGLAYFRYRSTGRSPTAPSTGLEVQIEAGAVVAEPITYEDFLPVSAAGIFQSNLGRESGTEHAERANQGLFEEALGEPVLDPFALYAEAEVQSRAAVMAELGAC